MTRAFKVGEIIRVAFVLIFTVVAIVLMNRGRFDVAAIYLCIALGFRMDLIEAKRKERG